MQIITELIREVDCTIESLKNSPPNTLYSRPIHQVAVKADTPAITKNIKLYQKVMNQIKGDITGFEKNSKEMAEFQEQVSLYVKVNPMTTTNNMAALLKAVDAPAVEFSKLVTGLPPGGTQLLVKEVIRSDSLELMTNLGKDVQSSIRNILEESVNNQRGMRYARDEMTKNIEGMTRNRAEVIARTETVRARNQAELIKAEAAGKEYFIVISASDCCDECYDTYDGNTFQVPEDEDMLPPLHPNCRCTATFFKSEEQAGRMSDEISKPRGEDEE